MTKVPVPLDYLAEASLASLDPRIRQDVQALLDHWANANLKVVNYNLAKAILRKEAGSLIPFRLSEERFAAVSLVLGAFLSRSTSKTWALIFSDLALVDSGFWMVDAGGSHTYSDLGPVPEKMFSLVLPGPIADSSEAVHQTHAAPWAVLGQIEKGFQLGLGIATGWLALSTDAAPGNLRLSPLGPAQEGGRRGSFRSTDLFSPPEVLAWANDMTRLVFRAYRPESIIKLSALGSEHAWLRLSDDRERPPRLALRIPDLTGDAVELAPVVISRPWQTYRFVRVPARNTMPMVSVPADLIGLLINEHGWPDNLTLDLLNTIYPWTEPT